MCPIGKLVKYVKNGRDNRAIFPLVQSYVGFYAGP